MRARNKWDSNESDPDYLTLIIFGLLLVTLSVVEGSPADWLRSFGYAQDDRVWARDD